MVGRWVAMGEPYSLVFILQRFYNWQPMCLAEYARGGVQGIRDRSKVEAIESGDWLARGKERSEMGG